MLESERHEQQYRDYIGESTWLIASVFCKYVGAENHMPEYLEYFYPESKPKTPTAKEIKDHVVEMLSK